MGLSIGDGITIMSVVGFVITVLYYFRKKKDDKNGHCADHSGVCATLDGFDAWLARIEDKLDRVIEGRGYSQRN